MNPEPAPGRERSGFITNPVHVLVHNVGIEPSLQPVTGENLSYRSANREDGARSDRKEEVPEGHLVVHPQRRE